MIGPVALVTQARGHDAASPAADPGISFAGLLDGPGRQGDRGDSAYGFGEFGLLGPHRSPGRAASGHKSGVRAEPEREASTPGRRSAAMRPEDQAGTRAAAIAPVRGGSQPPGDVQPRSGANDSPGQAPVPAPAVPWSAASQRLAALALASDRGEAGAGARPADRRRMPAPDADPILVHIAGRMVSLCAGAPGLDRGAKARLHRRAEQIIAASGMVLLEFSINGAVSETPVHPLTGVAHGHRPR